MMVGKVVHTSVTELMRYHADQLSNGNYHLEERKAHGEFLGVLAEERGFTARTIIKSDPRFEAFAELDIGTHSGRKLE